MPALARVQKRVNPVHPEVPAEPPQGAFHGKLLVVLEGLRFQGLARQEAMKQKEAATHAQQAQMLSDRTRWPLSALLSPTLRAGATFKNAKRTLRQKPAKDK